MDARRISVNTLPARGTFGGLWRWMTGTIALQISLYPWRGEVLSASGWGHAGALRSDERTAPGCHWHWGRCNSWLTLASQPAAKLSSNSLGSVLLCCQTIVVLFGSLIFEEYFLFNSRQVLSTVTVECWSLKEEPSTKTGISKGKAGLSTVSCGGFSWCLWWEKHGKVLDRFSGQHGQLLA